MLSSFYSGFIKKNTSKNLLCKISFKFGMANSSVLRLMANMWQVTVNEQSKVWGLWPLSCWDYRFKSFWGHGCLSLVSVVCYRVEVSCVRLITYPEESYWVWSRSPVRGGHESKMGWSATQKKKFNMTPNRAKAPYDKKKFN